METETAYPAAPVDRGRHSERLHHSSQTMPLTPEMRHFGAALVSPPGIAVAQQPYWPRTRVEAAQRFCDVLLASILLLLLLPVFLVIALLIRCDSPGQPLFMQTRVGRRGREFNFFKFRSMYQDAEARRAALEQNNERSGPVFKMQDDPRITRVGRFLRRASLDELPQLLNVLRGEMSLVGPRPALPHEVARYSDAEIRRLEVMPGLTGLWQVSGRADLSFEESIALDLRYIQEYSLTLYVQILLRTLPAVLRAKGAY
jgi:lipopolysaccharide/colanic/teichoic acid biosynthesis glycosyltransferase